MEGRGEVLRMTDIANLRPVPTAADEHRKRALDRRLQDLFRESCFVSEYEVKQVYLNWLWTRNNRITREFSYEQHLKARMREGETIHMQSRFPVHPKPDGRTHDPAEHFELPTHANPAGKFNRAYVTASDEDRTFLK